MLFVISPAKSLNMENSPYKGEASMPQHLQRSEHLVRLMAKFTPNELASLMKISDKLAALNAARFAAWAQPFDKPDAKEAIFAFNGDVYEGLDALSMDDEGLSYANKHSRILSGLYGLLRPLDLILPYRLEMGTKLKTDKFDNLYKFWGDELAKNIVDEMVGEPVLINLASNEYFKAVDTNALTCPVITPVFKDYKNGKYKIISFYAKRARGLMLRYAIDNKVSKASELKTLQPTAILLMSRHQMINSGFLDVV